MRGALAVIALVAAGGCGGSPPASRTGSWLEAAWTGSDTGRISAAAFAEWCDTLRLLEVRAIQGDSGLALAIYPSDTVAPGQYRVRPPGRADSIRPGAGVAVRWFGELAISGFRGDSGAVVLAGAGAGAPLSGSFEARARALGGSGRLTVRGSFGGLTVRSASPGCAGQVESPSADTGVN